MYCAGFPPCYFAARLNVQYAFYEKRESGPHTGQNMAEDPRVNALYSSLQEAFSPPNRHHVRDDSDGGMVAASASVLKRRVVTPDADGEWASNKVFPEVAVSSAAAEPAGDQVPDASSSSSELDTELDVTPPLPQKEVPSALLKKRPVKLPKRTAWLFRALQMAFVGLSISAVVFFVVMYGVDAYMATQYDSREEIDRATPLPLDKVEIFATLYTRLPRDVFSTKQPQSPATPAANQLEKRRDLNLSEDLNGDDVPDEFERAVFKRKYDLEVARALMENGESFHEQHLQTGRERPAELTMESLPRPVDFSPVDCPRFTQFTPVRDSVRVKRGCWDVFYEFFLRDRFTPAKFMLDFTTYLTENDEVQKNNAAANDAQRELKKKQQRTDLKLQHDASTDLRWKLYDQNRDKFQCVCSEAMEMLTKFVFICNPTPAEDKCVMLIAPTVQRFNFSAAPARFQDNPFVDYSIKARPDFQRIYKAFESFLDIRDSGDLVGRKTINVSYYELPDLQKRLQYYGPTHGHPYTSYVNVFGHHEEIRTNRKNSLFYDLADSIRDWRLPAVQDQMAMQDIVYKRENISIHNSLRLSYLLAELNKRRADPSASGWDIGKMARDVKYAFASEKERCESMKRRIKSLPAASDEELLKLSPDCLRDLFQRPRLIERTNVPFSGNAAACILQCNRFTDLLDAQRYQVFNSMYNQDQQDIGVLINKLKGRNAYSGRI